MEESFMDPTLAIQSFGLGEQQQQQAHKMMTRELVKLRSMPSPSAAAAHYQTENSKHHRTAFSSANNNSLQPAASEHHSGQSQLSEDSDMSSKPYPAPPKPYNHSHFQPLLYPLYMNTDLHVPSQATHQFYTGASVEELRSIEHTNLGLEKPGASQLELCLDEQQARSGLSSEAATGRFKHWTFDQERNIHGGYNLSPLLEVAHNNQTILTSHGLGEGIIAGNNLLGSSSVSENINVVESFVPLSNSNTLSEQRVQQPYNLARFQSTRSQYSPDMEILRVSQQHNSSSGVNNHHNSSSGVHQQLYEAVPSAIMHRAPTHNIGASSTYNISRAGSGYNSVQNNASSQQQLDWAVNAAAGAHELLLLPRAESVIEAAAGTTSAVSGSKLDLLHASSLQDKRPLPFNGLGSHQANDPLHLAHWDDKLDMAVGLHDARSMFQEDPFLSVGNSTAARQQSGLSLFLQSPQHRQTNLSLDAARYTSRSGSLGVLRHSKYLKAAQQLLNEFCNVGRDAIPLKSSHHSIVDLPQAWNVEGAANGDALTMRAFNRQKDMNFYHPTQFKSADHHHGQFPHSRLQAVDSQLSPPTDPSAPPKQLPADERCHLQMRKARLIGMVEELDRRYQQYRDQMQLIVTSFESATGLGAAAPYTALRRRATSRQFRGLRDAIGENIHKVCKALGEELSSVPILSKGETPRLRILDQRIRHQRALQQIGMLQQQQAWRPQRGLPERSVSVLRAWLFEHFLHPYPKDSEKLMLARLTGLSRNQVSNWFINARVRLWKPMVEEMYVEEGKELELNEAAAADVGSTSGATTTTTASTDGKSLNGQATANWPEASYTEHVGAYGETIQAGTRSAQQVQETDGIALLTQLQPTHSLEPLVHGFNASSIIKNGVSLTLGLQQSSSHPNTTPSDHRLQPPQASSYSNAYNSRPSEVLRF